MSPDKQRKSLIPEGWLESAKESSRRRERNQFGTKLSVIDDLCFSLLNTDQFPKEIEEIRQEHCIPATLNPEEDSPLFYDGPMRDSPFSVLWEERGSAKEAAFDKNIRDLIDSYEYVPSYLFRWIKHVAMYRSELPWQPKQDLSLLTDLLKNPEDISKLPLNDEERDNLMSMARAVLKQKQGRPSKETQPVLAAIRAILTKGKTRFRGMRIKKRAREVLSLKQQYDISYHEIATEIFHESDYTKEELHDAHVNNAKQMRSALLERMNELTKKKVGK